MIVRLTYYIVRLNGIKKYVRIDSKAQMMLWYKEENEDGEESQKETDR